MTLKSFYLAVVFDDEWTVNSISSIEQLDLKMMFEGESYASASQQPWRTVASSRERTATETGEDW